MDKQTILIVEDNPITRKMLRVTLTTAGYNVLEAEDGKTALQHMQKTTLHLILQDFLLPDMDGLELNRRLRSLPNGAELPILALSGFLSKMEELQAKGAAGFTAYLIKPIEPSRLLEVIAAYLPSLTPIASPVGKNQHILIVDDDPIQLKLLRIRLQQAGFRVTTAFDGADALEKAHRDPPDAIISDLLMPRLDGFELCLQVRQDLKLAHLPVIFVTSQYLEEPDRTLAKNIGANGYINRTVEMKELLELLSESLKAKPPVVSPLLTQVIKEEHTHRLVRQLERQTITNVGLAQHCALQAAQLALFGGVADALASQNNIDIVLQNVLATCLDAAGISKGVLYLKGRHNKLSYRQLVGYTDKESEQLTCFFGQPELLTRVMSANEVIEIPSTTIPEEIAFALLKGAGIETAILVPLISTIGCFGVLFFGSKVTKVVTSEAVIFARTLGARITQIVALATAFERLAISEKRSRTLMENASCGIFIHDQAGIIFEANKQSERIFGYPKSELIGKDFIDFIIPGEREYAAVQLKKLLIEKRIGPNEGHIQQPDGRTCNVEFSSVCVEVGDEMLMLSILNDVTERNQLRTQALLNDRLATVGTLAAGVAHEINNPIAWILANLNFLKRHVKTFQECVNTLRELAQDPASHQKFPQLEALINDQKQQKLLLEFDEIVNESVQGAERIRDIVRNLKGFARVDDRDVTPVDIHEILNVAANMAYPEFKYRAKLETNFDTNLPKIPVNSGKLHQVFLNLIVNAAQAIPENNLQNNKIRIATHLEKDRICIDISDTGIGIPRETLSQIFEPFFTTKPVGTGTGLGLSICYEIIHKLGGEIRVQSVPKQGTIFSVHIPLQPAAKLPERSQSEIAHANSKTHLRVLVVDDEPYLLETIQQMLEDQHEVTIALGGRAALELLVKNVGAFDAVISDLCMPDVNGADLYRFLAEKYPELTQYIIFITGGVYNPVLKEFLSQVKNLCIEKPFTQEALLKMIDEVVATKK